MPAKVIIIRISTISYSVAGIPVAETGILARRDGTKNVPPPYKQQAIKTIETYTCRDPGHRPVPINVRPASHKNRPNRTIFIGKTS